MLFFKKNIEKTKLHNLCEATKNIAFKFKENPSHALFYSFLWAVTQFLDYDNKELTGEYERIFGKRNIRKIEKLYINEYVYFNVGCYISALIIKWHSKNKLTKSFLTEYISPLFSKFFKFYHDLLKLENSNDIGLHRLIIYAIDNIETKNFYFKEHIKQSANNTPPKYYTLQNIDSMPVTISSYLEDAVFDLEIRKIYEVTLPGLLDVINELYNRTKSGESEIQPSEPKEPRKNVEILNIEDSKMFVDLLHSSITKELGIEPKSFTNTSDLIEYCEKNPHNVDLIITNYMMPRHNGIELIKLLDNILEKPAFAILHSGFLNNESEEVKDFLNMRFKNIKPVCFFKKPIDMKSFSKKIKEIYEISAKIK